jgi:hypothetical protein
LATPRDYGFEIKSTIIGFYNQKIYKVDYCIKTTNEWETKSFEIKSRHSNQTQSLIFEGDGKGNWISGDRHWKEFAGCIDIDIPLTPFTNTLPIRRLQLAKGATQKIKVLYIDLLEQKLTAVHQKYTRVSDLDYHYENVPNDFEATIRVDESGFVIDYPSLFVRTALVQTNYP